MRAMETKMDQASELANTIAARMNAYSADDKDSTDEIAFELRNKDAELERQQKALTELEKAASHLTMRIAVDSTIPPSTMLRWRPEIEAVNAAVTQARALLNGGSNAAKDST
jgi:hypothetical protein